MRPAFAFDHVKTQGLRQLGKVMNALNRFKSHQERIALVQKGGTVLWPQGLEHTQLFGDGGKTLLPLGGFQTRQVFAQDFEVLLHSKHSLH